MLRNVFALFKKAFILVEQKYHNDAGNNCHLDR